MKTPRDKMIQQILEAAGKKNKLRMVVTCTANNRIHVIDDLGNNYDIDEVSKEMVQHGKPPNSTLFIELYEDWIDMFIECMKCLSSDKGTVASAT